MTDETTSAIAEPSDEATAASAYQALPVKETADDAAYYRHLIAIDIPAWQYRQGDWFTIHLFRIMQKADGQNFMRLSAVFPTEARAFKHWQSGAWEQAEHEKRQASAIAERNGETT